ncbi:dehydratase [Rhodococcus sp. SC4]|nr:dehydratase [Rhodococcus sp. SC4]
MARMSLSDLSTAAGVDLGVTEWIPVSQDRIDLFADATDDHQWIHIDAGKASSGPFGGTIAHGYLTLSLAGAAVADLLVVPDAGSIVNYGLGKVRFPSPVPSGSLVRVRGRIEESVEVAGGYQVTVGLTAEREGSDRPVCVAEGIVRFLK